MNLGFRSLDLDENGLRGWPVGKCKAAGRGIRYLQFDNRIGNSHRTLSDFPIIRVESEKMYGDISDQKVSVWKGSIPQMFCESDRSQDINTPMTEAMILSGFAEFLH